MEGNRKVERWRGSRLRRKNSSCRMNSPADTVSDVPLKRPLGLSIILVLLIAANIYGGTTVLLRWSEFLQQFPSLSPVSLAALGLSAVVSIIGRIGIWMWKRWAVILVTFMALLVLIMEIAFLGATLKTFRIPISYALLILFLWPVRTRFR